MSFQPLDSSLSSPIIVPLLWMKKLRHKLTKHCAQGHTANRSQKRNSNGRSTVTGSSLLKILEQGLTRKYAMTINNHNFSLY